MSTQELQLPGSGGGDSRGLNAERVAKAVALLREALGLLGLSEFPFSSIAPAVAPDRLLRLPEVQQLTGLKRSAIYEQMQKRTFPRSFKVGPRAAGWSETSIQAWIAERMEAGGTRTRDSRLDTRRGAVAPR